MAALAGLPRSPRPRRPAPGPRRRPSPAPTAWASPTTSRRSATARPLSRSSRAVSASRSARPAARGRAPRRCPTGATGIAAPDVAFDGAGEVIVAWTQNTAHGAAPPQGPSYVRVAVRGAGGRWGAPRTVGRTSRFIDAQPRLAANTRGDAVLVWRGLRGAGARARDVLQAAYRAAGGAFGEARSLGEPGIDLQVAIDDGGTAYAVWSHAQAPSFVASSIRLVRRTRSGSWTRPSTVAAVAAGGPQLALPGDGDLLVAFRGQPAGRRRHADRLRHGRRAHARRRR